MIEDAPPPFCHAHMEGPFQIDVVRRHLGKPIALAYRIIICDHHNVYCRVLKGVLNFIVLRDAFFLPYLFTT